MPDYEFSFNISVYLYGITNIFPKLYIESTLFHVLQGWFEKYMQNHRGGTTGASRGYEDKSIDP